MNLAHESMNWIPLVAITNPTGGPFVVWPGMLFPNSRGNKAETNLRPLESRLAIESRLANYDSEFHLAISSSILAYLGEEIFDSCDVMCIVWSFFRLPRNVASNAKLLKLLEFWMFTRSLS